MMLLRVTYGVEPSETNDKYFRMVESVINVGDNIAVPGRYLVEAFPLIRFIPSWLPGGSFKRYAAHAKASIEIALDELFNTAVNGLVSVASLISQSSVH